MGVTVELLVALGFALGMAGPPELGNAANTLRAALGIAPGDGRARRGLVEVLVKANRPAEAIEAQRALVSAEPADKEARRRIAGLLRASSVCSSCVSTRAGACTISRPRFAMSRTSSPLRS